MTVTKKWKHFWGSFLDNLLLFHLYHERTHDLRGGLLKLLSVIIPVVLVQSQWNAVNIELEVQNSESFTDIQFYLVSEVGTAS